MNALNQFKRLSFFLIVRIRAIGIPLEIVFCHNGKLPTSGLAT